MFRCICRHALYTRACPLRVTRRPIEWRRNTQEPEYSAGEIFFRDEEGGERKRVGRGEILNVLLLNHNAPGAGGCRTQKGEEEREGVRRNKPEGLRDKRARNHCVASIIHISPVLLIFTCRNKIFASRYKNSCQFWMTSSFVHWYFLAPLPSFFRNIA